jgi:diphosphomevalonate decarboxylase
VNWEGDRIREIQGSLPPLIDLLLVIEEAAKEVSSSDAHRRCAMSPLFQGRDTRATERCGIVERAIESGDLARVAQEAWMDAWEMHSLFHTSSPPFTYFKPRTIEALQWFSGFLNDRVPPIVTLDAGPNLHVLVPEADAGVWEKRISGALPGIPMKKSCAGSGASWIG